MVRKLIPIRHIGCLTTNIAISAIVVAIQMIGDYCKKLKYRRKIVLVTDGRGSMDDDGVDEIVNKIKEDNIELVVLCGYPLHASYHLTNPLLGE